MEPPYIARSVRSKKSGAILSTKIVTLLTDFGLQDPYVGIMKGVILSINPEATIIDITHNVEPQNIEEAAFLIEEYNRFFPLGAIHTAIIDPTVGSERRSIIVSKNGNIFLGPDNGLFTLILDDEAEAYLIENPDFMLKEISSTFHGRDIFAPAAGHASKGVHPAAFGRPVADPVHLSNMLPIVEGQSLKGRVIRFDRFGNAITNIKIDFLKALLNNRSFEVHLGGMTFGTLSKSYHESEFTCLIGSSGYLEFGYFKGSFKDKCNITRNDSVLITILVSPPH
jgi:S-adenosyl-L-methionine hydrolase (adenosine-forming)